MVNETEISQSGESVLEKPGRIKVAYVIGPIRSVDPKNIHRRVENIRRAEAAAIELWQNGFAVICPQLNTGMLSGVCPEENFLKGDIEMLSRCDFAVIVGECIASEGSLSEINWCYKNGKLVYNDVAKAIYCEKED